MGNVWVWASVWVGLALIATLLELWFKISTGLTEIVVGTAIVVGPPVEEIGDVLTGGGGLV